MARSSPDRVCKCKRASLLSSTEPIWWALRLWVFALDDHTWLQGGGNRQDSGRFLGWLLSFQHEVFSLPLPSPPLIGQLVFSCNYDTLSSWTHPSIPPHDFRSAPWNTITSILLGTLPYSIQLEESDSKGLCLPGKRMLTFSLIRGRHLLFFQKTHKVKVQNQRNLEKQQDLWKARFLLTLEYSQLSHPEARQTTEYFLIIITSCKGGKESFVAWQQRSACFSFMPSLKHSLPSAEPNDAKRPVTRTN